MANAVLDGTDAVMFSEETAIGRFPVEAVTMMAAIAADAESSFPFDAWIRPLRDQPAIARGGRAGRLHHGRRHRCRGDRHLTQSGSTARRVAQYRPRAPIIAPTPHAETYRRLALVWGVTPLLNRSQPTTDELIDGALGAALAAGRAQHGDTVVITAGVPVGRPGTTNLIKVEIL